MAYKKANGYLQGSIDDKKVHAHRVAFKWMTGVDPDDVDHINGDRADNRFANLRSCSRCENLHNAKLSARNKSGAPGVRRTKSGTWDARINFNMRAVHIGTFGTFEEAREARANAEREFGYHQNHGR